MSYQANGNYERTPLERVREWVERFVESGAFILLICAGFVVGLVYAAHIQSERERQERDDFMAECMRERKHYECQAMWRAGEKHTELVPVVMPVVVR